MTLASSLRRAVAALVLGLSALAHAQTPPQTPDIPAKFAVATGAYDYERREVMIPARDGVKLHTVIVVPKGARNAPILLTRTPTTPRSVSSAARARTRSRPCRRVTRCSWPTATSACSRTFAASTARKATT